MVDFNSAFRNLSGGNQMSQEVLQAVIRRAIEDEAFRQLLFSDPQTALEGFNLTDEEQALFEGLNQENFEEFAGRLGGRDTKGLAPRIG
jgi:hypothetical protein